MMAWMTGFLKLGHLPTPWSIMEATLALRDLPTLATSLSPNLAYKVPSWCQLSGHKKIHSPFLLDTWWEADLSVMSITRHLHAPHTLLLNDICMYPLYLEGVCLLAWRPQMPKHGCPIPILYPPKLHAKPPSSLGQQIWAHLTFAPEWLSSDPDQRKSIRVHSISLSPYKKNEYGPIVQLESPTHWIHLLFCYPWSPMT